MSGPALGVLLSGGGRTLQNLIDRIADGRLDARIACVVADREDAFGLQRARDAGLPACFERDHDRVFELLREHGVELVCLAGYLRLLPVPADFAGAILNIHPALLPKYGGKGFYGDRVHRAVLAAGDDVSGCTVHVVDELYDHGEVLVQRRVSVEPGDTVETLGARVFEAECEAYPEAIEAWTARARRPAAPDRRAASDGGTV